LKRFRPSSFFCQDNKTTLHSEKIYGAKAAYDYVNRCWSRYQTVVTAAIANPHRIDGVAVEVQFPNDQKEELAYLAMTAQESYEQMEQVYQRLEQLLHHGTGTKTVALTPHGFDKLGGEAVS
jgi:hypothetical protein